MYPNRILLFYNTKNKRKCKNIEYKHGHVCIELIRISCLKIRSSDRGKAFRRNEKERIQWRCFAVFKYNTVQTPCTQY